eukprot:TRINITY_DN7718_c0_g1_i1.p1 TRINITY_DN7718_c0_g1~~TRINITY_DN7718_c0_g1_i1.p1  ORF type:complete len:1017 (-),score=221.20 TRINITY_DN7718_c0_g1_i1:77-3127(-)
MSNANFEKRGFLYRRRKWRSCYVHCHDKKLKLYRVSHGSEQESFTEQELADTRLYVTFLVKNETPISDIQIQDIIFYIEITTDDEILLVGFEEEDHATNFLNCITIKTPRGSNKLTRTRSANSLSSRVNINRRRLSNADAPNENGGIHRRSVTSIDIHFNKDGRPGSEEIVNRRAPPKKKSSFFKGGKAKTINRYHGDEIRASKSRNRISRLLSARKRPRLEDFANVEVSGPVEHTVDQDSCSTNEKSSEEISTPRVKVPTIELTQTEKQALKRLNVAKEILTTEETYVENLKEVLKVYIKPIIDRGDSLGVSVSRLKLTLEYIPELIEFHEVLLDSFRNIINEWDEDSLFGKLFLDNAENFRMYSEYSNHYEIIIEWFNEAMLNEKFQIYHQKVRQKLSSFLGLDDLLITPVQRIPRYSLLLRDLIKNTDEDHPDYSNLQKSSEMMTDTVEFMNEEVRKAENNRKVEKMAENGIRLENVIKDGRWMVREGAVKSKKKRAYHIFLFNDCFVHAKKETLKNDDLTSPNHRWPISLIWLIPQGADIVKIIGPTGSLSIIDTDNWRSDIEKTGQEFINNGDHGDWDDIRKDSFTFPSGCKYSGEWKRASFHGQGTMEFLGNTYIGNWTDGKRMGQGKEKFSTGHVYTGNWIQDVPSGTGKITYPNGSSYIGDWKAGKRDGDGRIDYKNGDIYEGEWKNDKIEGVGSLLLTNGTSYEGDFVNGKYEGEGKLCLPQGSVYSGEFSRGQMHGKGVLVLGNGCTYKGNFSEDYKNGHGTWKGINKSRYEGSWLNDEFHGDGKIRYPDGSLFDGEFQYGKKHGNGNMLYSNGCTYNGEWFDDKRNGHGIYTSPSGELYEGQWVKGYKEGRGTLHFPNSSFYSGIFFRDKFHKSGVYTGGDKDWIQKYDGEWKHGQIDGKGSIKFQNGDEYKGTFIDHMFNGHGTYTYCDGTVVSGKWVDSILVGKINIDGRDGAIKGGNVDPDKFQTYTPSADENFTLPLLPIVPIPPIHYDRYVSRNAEYITF